MALDCPPPIAIANGNVLTRQLSAPLDGPMSGPHPFAPVFEHAFTISIDLTQPYWVEPSVRGDKRAAIFAAAGTVEGPRLNGRVIPMSGGDFPLVRDNG